MSGQYFEKRISFFSDQFAGCLSLFFYLTNNPNRHTSPLTSELPASIPLPLPCSRRLQRPSCCSCRSHCRLGEPDRHLRSSTTFRAPRTRRHHCCRLRSSSLSPNLQPPRELAPNPRSSSSASPLPLAPMWFPVSHFFARALFAVCTSLHCPCSMICR
jgi:hypothetical protein